MKTFKSFEEALRWGKINAADYCHFYHSWRVVREGAEFAIGIFNRNNGARETFVKA